MPVCAPKRTASNDHVANQNGCLQKFRNFFLLDMPSTITALIVSNSHFGWSITLSVTTPLDVSSFRFMLGALKSILLTVAGSICSVNNNSHVRYILKLTFFENAWFHTQGNKVHVLANFSLVQASILRSMAAT